MPADTSTVSGTKIRITVKAGSAVNLGLLGASIGVMTTNEVFDTAPTRITFSGSNTATVTAGETMVSDEITFTFDKTARHGIHVHTSNVANSSVVTNSVNGSYWNWTDGDVTMVQDMDVDGSSATSAYVLTKLEVYSGQENAWQTALTTEPKIVFFDGTKGTNETSVANLSAAREWFWAANVLTVYAASDPDTLYTAPGIEAGARDNAALVSGKNYVTLDGLDLRRTNTHALQLEGNITGVVAQNCTLSWAAGQGIIMWATAGGGLHQIADCTIHDVGNVGVTLFDVYSGAGTESAFSGNTIYNTGTFGLYHKANYWVIEHNTVYDVGTVGVANWGIGIQSELVDSGTGQHNIVRYNTIHGVKGDNTDACGIMLDHWTTANEVSYNLSYNNQGTGLTVYNATTSTVYNNVLYGNNQSGTDAYPGEVSFVSSGDVFDAITLKNNIAVATVSGTYAVVVNAEAAGNTLTITNNDWYRASGNWYSWAGTPGATLSTWNALAAGIGTDLNADPLFVSTVTPNFRLQSTSPCRDAGVDVSLTADIVGHKVPLGAAPDCGAYEWGGFMPLWIV